VSPYIYQAISLLSFIISSVLSADVGGFFLNPDSELLVRWYQVGMFLFSGCVLVVFFRQ